ncbi:MAG: hydrolase [Clostridiales Family XIII bacterium]|jgi:nicotinamidase-related amidase|nr:hydrolase [Clostridiales Family XIII bacterium]
MRVYEGKPKRIRKGEAVLVVVDLQERLIPAMREGASAVAEAAKLIRGFEAAGCPVLVTQQYTKGLGETVPEIKEAFASFSHIEKSAFSAMGEPGFADALGRTGKKAVVLCGVEAHVCVLQSALDMLEAGYDVFLAVDAVSSRKERDEKPAIKRMLHSGVLPTTAESVLFELLDNDSKSETFKTISKLIK